MNTENTMLGKKTNNKWINAAWFQLHNIYAIGRVTETANRLKVTNSWEEQGMGSYGLMGRVSTWARKGFGNSGEGHATLCV